MEKELLAYGVPLLVLLLSAPMALGKVPPNGIYGFRTRKTISSPEIWYPANRASGWFMVAAAAVSLAFNLAVSSAFPEWPIERAMPWIVGGNLIPLGAATVASLIYLRRL